MILAIPATRLSVIATLSSLAHHAKMFELHIFDASPKGIPFSDLDRAILRIFGDYTVHHMHGQSAAVVKSNIMRMFRTHTFMLCDDDLIFCTFTPPLVRGVVTVGNNIETVDDFTMPKIDGLDKVFGVNIWQTSYSCMVIDNTHMRQDVFAEFVRRGIYRGIDEVILFEGMRSGECVFTPQLQYYHVGANGMYSEKVQREQQKNARRNLYDQFDLLTIAKGMWKE
jgi:hypothetical protein